MAIATKTAKIEIRVADTDKTDMLAHAAAAGYGAREFSMWARRVLLGLERHPDTPRRTRRTR